MKLRNENVLIFGGGSGIGKAIAVRFLEAGAQVCIAGRSREKLEAPRKRSGGSSVLMRSRNWRFIS